MGNIFGGGTSTSTVQQKSDPWAPQQSFLTQGFNQAATNLANQQAAGPYTGNFVAGGNPALAGAISGATNYANGTGANLAGSTANTAGGLLGAASPFVGNAENLAANGAGVGNSPFMNTLGGYATGAKSIQGPTGALSDALNGAAVNGANSINGFTNGLLGAANSATQDRTGQTINDANQYVNSSGTQDAIKNINSQIEQQLHEQTIPGLNEQAAMGGGLNSSRAGMAEGLANQSAALAEGNADSQITNNAFNTGVSTSAAQQAANLQAAISANEGGIGQLGSLAGNVAGQQQQLGEANASNQLGASQSALATLLQNAGLENNANAQLGEAAGMGFNGATTSGNLAAGDFGLGSQAGAEEQAIEQSGITNALDQWQMQNQYPTQALDNYWQVVGNPLGVSSTSTGTQTGAGPGVAAGVLGLGAGAAGLFGSNGAFPGALAGLGALL